MYWAILSSLYMYMYRMLFSQNHLITKTLTLKFIVDSCTMKIWSTKRCNS
jgi:hypothetical protein